jgi:hypothetical protein
MILGLSLHHFTLLHVALSLVGILTGLNVLLRMVRQRPLGASNTIFLVSTILTSVTGFLFPRMALTPAQIVGAVSLVVLASAAAALWLGNLYGSWRPIYVVSATIALYLNVMVAIVQAFAKISTLHRFAPIGNEPVVLAIQGAALLLFIALGYFAVKRFHPGGM